MRVYDVTSWSYVNLDDPSTERKIGLLPSMAIHISVTTCDACAADHVVRFTRPSPSVFAYWLQAIKNWSRGRPGNEATSRWCVIADTVHDIHR